MVSITCLPEEIITIILGYNVVSIEDIINFRCTCQQFRKAAGFVKFMDKKFSQRWPNGKKYYDKKSKYEIYELNLKDILKFEEKSEEESEEKPEQLMTMYKSLNFTKIGINSVKLLQNLMSKILDKLYYMNDLITNETDFDYNYYLENIMAPDYRKEHIDKNFVINTCISDEIKYLLTTESSRSANCDLTKRYCNMRLYNYLRRNVVCGKWNKFYAKPAEQQLMEQAATILAQYFQPEKDIFYSRVKASLNTIAQNALNLLRKKYPDHSIFWTSAENFSYWENNNINNNYWDEAEGTQIMDTLQEYIFAEFNYRLHEKEDDDELELFCIDNVLENKYGNNMMLLTIYHSVARRLGLWCDIINIFTKGKICIFWKSKYATNSLENVRCFYISSDKFPDCPIKMSFSEPSYYYRMSAIQLFEEILFKLEDFPWKNRILEMPPLEILLSSLSICKDEKYGTFEFSKLNQLIGRPNNIKFAVGMIVKHKEHNKNESHESTNGIRGVIVGWHKNQFGLKKIFASLSNHNRHKIIFYYNLTPFNNYSYNAFLNASTYEQPHYIILTEKNTLCFINEDVLTLTTGWVENYEIGRYFCKFEDTHYVPNKIIAELYPHDAAIIKEKNNQIR